MGYWYCVDQSGLDEGVIVRPIAAGASNTTNKDRPLGICVGNNRLNPVYNATYQAEYITDPGVTGLRSDTAEYVMVDGVWSKGEQRAMVLVALIDGPQTILRASLRNAAIGTAITELVSTAGNANGLTVTTDATDVAGVVDLNTLYCRTGGNAGVYRQTDDTSTTVHTWDVEMPVTTNVAGEKYVKVPVRSHGISYVTIGDGTVASFIDSAKTPATDYDIIHVRRLDLRVAGDEFVEFQFDADAFCTARA